MKKTLLFFASLMVAVFVWATPTPGPRTVSIDGSSHEVKNTDVKNTTGQIKFPTVDPHVFNAGYWKDGVLTQSYTATPTPTPTPTATFTPTPTPTTPE